MAAPGPRATTAPPQPPAPAAPPATRPAPPPAAAPAPAPTPAGNDNAWVVPLCILIVGMFMSVLDTSIVNIAIPKMQTALSASVDDIEWVVTGYTLVLGVVVPLTGWLGLRLGLTRLYVLSMLGFALGSALCGFAWNLNSMVAFRVVQAIPGGMLPVVTLTMLYQIVPRIEDRHGDGALRARRGRGAGHRPDPGRLPGGVLRLAADLLHQRADRHRRHGAGRDGVPADPADDVAASWTSWGFVTIAYALFALLLAFSEGQSWGWTGYRVLGLFVSAALSLALFVIIENEVDNPLIDLRVFRSFPFSLSLVLIGITITGLFSALYFLPQFLQQVQGLQELDSGLVLLPGALVLVVLMPIAGRLYDIIGPRYPADGRAAGARPGLVPAGPHHRGHAARGRRVVARRAQCRGRAVHDADHHGRDVGAAGAHSPRPDPASTT